MPQGGFARDLEKCYLIEFGTRKPKAWQKLSLWTNHFGLHCVAGYRFGQWAMRFQRRHILLGLLPRALHAVLNMMLRVLHHVELHVVDIGPGLYIGHAHGIYVGASSIGENFSITHHVTIGLGHSSGKEGKPHIGNNVWVGTSTVVAGAICVGDNVTISPGTFLTRSVPEGCLVGGNPGRVLVNNYDNKKLLPAETIVEARTVTQEQPLVAPVTPEARVMAESK